MSEKDMPTGLEAFSDTSSGRGGRQAVSEFKDLWKQGMRTEAQAFLAQHPHLRSEKSTVLDLAYEEYCQRREAGASPDPDEFCDKFAEFKTSLRRLIQADRFLEENPSLLGEGPVDWPAPGDTFLGFSLVRELGRGAFARVFLATEPALGDRRVAVKISFGGAAEAETLGRLNHPNVVPVHSVQENLMSGMTVVCMPFLGSATLCDVLDHVAVSPGLPQRARVILEAIQGIGQPGEGIQESRPADPFLTGGTYVDGAVYLIAQLAEALAAVHAKGIYHRDLKPSNVLMSPDGRPMLLDFNLSFDEQIADHRLGGTLPYMAPEHLLATDLEGDADPSLIDARSDVFSLGVILYELLTGSHPFGPLPLKLPSQEVRRLLLERQQTGPHPLRKANPRVDRPLARVVERCLAYNPNDRPQSAAGLAEALRKSLSRPRRLRRWMALHPRLAVGSGLLALAVAIAGGHVLATQESFSQRQVGLAREASRHGQYEVALNYADRALVGDENNPQALFLRGWGRQHVGNISGAKDDYERAEELNPDPQVELCLGDCYTRFRLFQSAINSYNKALEAGLNPPEVFNNLGYNYVEISASKPDQEEKGKDLDKAQEYLDQAIALNPQLQVARYNRGLVDLQRSTIRPWYVPYQGMADIRQAIELGPVTAELYRDASYLYAVAAYHERLRVTMDVLNSPAVPVPGPNLYGDLAYWCASTSESPPLWDQASLDYLYQAVQEGEKPGPLVNNPLFEVLKHYPQFQALVKLSPPKQPLEPSLFVDTLSQISP